VHNIVISLFARELADVGLLPRYVGQPFFLRYRGIAQPNALDVSFGDKSASTSVRRSCTHCPLRFIVGTHIDHGQKDPQLIERRCAGLGFHIDFLERFVPDYTSFGDSQPTPYRVAASSNPRVFGEGNEQRRIQRS
jgi:hypothetical protein